MAREISCECMMKMHHFFAVKKFVGVGVGFGVGGCCWWLGFSLGLRISLSRYEIMSNSQSKPYIISVGI